MKMDLLLKNLHEHKNKEALELSYEKLIREGKVMVYNSDWTTRYVIYAVNNKLSVKIIDEKTKTASINTNFTDKENYGSCMCYETFKKIYTHIRTNLNDTIKK